MKTTIVTALLLLATHLQAEPHVNFHSFTVENITGEPLDLSSFKGKVVLVVNTASRCGFTRQYADLVKLHEAYADKNFEIIGFPANNFMNQEPGTNEEIAEFCEVNFGVQFPMMARLSVRGRNQHDLFAYLTRAENPDFTGNINWNFEKFLIGADGNLLRRFRSRINPNDDRVREAIDAALAAAGN